VILEITVPDDHVEGWIQWVRDSLRACAENDDCPTDFECMGGLCERASCESNSDCDGVCVNHACHEEPGYCTNPHPSPPPEPSDSEIPIVIED